MTTPPSVAPPAGRLPLAGRRVLVPRATDGPDPLVIALHAAGAEPVVVPLIQTVPPEDPTDLDDLLLALDVGYYAWVAVTSTAAVSVLVDRASEVGRPLAEILDGVRVAAVGATTARALREAGLVVDLVPPRGRSSAAALVAAWPSVPGGDRTAAAAAHNDVPDGDVPDGDPVQARERRVLLPLGDLAADTLATRLRAGGWSVDVVVAYRTVAGPRPDEAVRAAWSEGGINAVLLTSGSTARNLVELLGTPPDGTLVCCIGTSTAEQARLVGLEVATIASEQTPTGLVDALVRAFAGRGRDAAPASTQGAADLARHAPGEQQGSPADLARHAPGDQQDSPADPETVGSPRPPSGGRPGEPDPAPPASRADARHQNPLLDGGSTR